MKRLLLFIFASLCLLALTAQAQTNVTGTFLAPSGKTPAQSGLKVMSTIAGTPVCGELDFTPWNLVLNQPVDMQWRTVTYLPSRVRGFVRCADGQLLNSQGSVGVTLIPNSDAQPTGTVYLMKGGLEPSTDGTIAQISYNEAKEIPDESSVDWTNLSVAQITDVGYSYVLQTNGYVIGYQTWQGTTIPSLPATGSAFVGYNPVSKVIQCVNPDGSSCFPGGLTNPMVGTGAMIYSFEGTPTSLVGNTTTTREFLISQGDGVNATAPAWGSIQTSDLPSWLASLNAVAGNCVVASPADGASSTPACRSLVAADLAGIPIATYLPVPVRSGDILYWNSGTGWTTIPGNNSGVSVLTENASGVPSWGINSAALTSVGLTQTGTVFTITNSPLLSNGTINLAFAQEPPNTVFANCGIANTLPTFCSLTTAMLPATTVTPGSYANANITVNAQGLITAAANGSATVSNLTVNGGSALNGTVNFANGSPVDGITISAQNPSASNITFVISGALTNAGIANPSMTVSGANCTLGGACTIAYSGLSGPPTLPGNAPSISHQWINSYNSTSGIFSQSQPAFTDIGGTLINAQLPTSGVTAGSYTCMNGTVNAQGILTAASSNSCAGSGNTITVNGGSALGSPTNFQTGTGSNIVDGITIVFVNSSGSNIQAAISGALTNSGLANSSVNVSGQSCVLGASCTVPYSGLSGTPTLPANTPAVTNEFLTAYNSTGGGFSQAQPTFANISGLLVNAQLPTSAVTPGSYTNANITVNAQGIVTAAANGSGGGSNITVNGGASLGSPVNFANGAAVDGLTINAQNLTGNNITFALSGTLTNAGLVNSSITVSTASCVLGGSCTIPYAGLSGTPTLPATTGAAAHEWLASYNAGTGVFTQTQPAYSDLTGTPTLYYQTVQASGGALTQRPIINFIQGTNVGILCADNSGATRTDCTFSLTGSFGNVFNSGTPTAGQLAQWVSSTAIQGITTGGGGTTPLMFTQSGSLVNGQDLCVAGGIFSNCTIGIPIVTQSGSTVTFGSGDRASFEDFTYSSGGITVNLPTPLGSNFFTDIWIPTSSGDVTLKTTGSNTINGVAAASVLVPNGSFGILYSDNTTDYYLVNVPTLPMFADCGSSPTCALAWNASSGNFSAVSFAPPFSSFSAHQYWGSYAGGPPTAQAILPSDIVTGTINSGGVACFTSTSVLSSSATLASGSILVGGGSGACPTAVSTIPLSQIAAGTAGTGAYSFANASYILLPQTTGEPSFVQGAMSQSLSSGYPGQSDIVVGTNGTSYLIFPYANITSPGWTNGDCLEAGFVSNEVFLKDSGVVGCSGAVSSVAGDGTVLASGAQTGAVALTLANFGAYAILNNNTNAGATPVVTNSPKVVGISLHASTFTNTGNCGLTVTNDNTNTLNICGTTMQIKSGQLITYNGNPLVDSGIPSEVSDTQVLTSKASLGSTSLWPTGNGLVKFTFSGTIAQMGLGTGCSTGGSIVVNLIYTDQLSGVALTQVLAIQSGSGTAQSLPFAASSGSIGAGNVGSFEYNGYADTNVSGGTAISYSTTYTAASGCSGSNAASYGIIPILTVK